MDNNEIKDLTSDEQKALFFKAHGFENPRREKITIILCPGPNLVNHPIETLIPFDPQ